MYGLVYLNVILLHENVTHTHTYIVCMPWYIIYIYIYYIGIFKVCCIVV